MRLKASLSIMHRVDDNFDIDTRKQRLSMQLGE